MPKIREVDDLLRCRPELLARVREVHPEVSFYFLAGERPQQYSKKTRVGREERRELLEPLFGERLCAALAERDRHATAEDDVLDAFVALWTAERIATETARVIPSTPQRDAFDLPMEIAA